MPVRLILEDSAQFDWYIGESYPIYQALIVLLTGCVLAGIAWGDRGRPLRLAPGHDPLVITNHRTVWQVALVLAVVGTGSWLWGIHNAGGLSGAYGTAYGGAKLASGYARELRNLGLLGVLLVYLTRRGRGMRPIDWVLVGICILPTIGHGLLGARRGPTFIAAAVAGAGYFFMIGRRVQLHTLAFAGIALGLLMLFLVANRSQIYIGSDVQELRGGLDYLVRWSSNEYLIGAKVMEYTQEVGGFYGRRQLAHLLGRLIPSALWPTVYEDLTRFFGLAINLRQNAGVDAEAVASIAGWQPSVGSATGFVGAMWLEFQYLAPVVAFLIGWLYASTWRRSQRDARSRIFYILLVALSVYLVMQDTDAWLYRVVMFYVILLILFPRQKQKRRRLRPQRMRR